jgi:GNAT superfamily N-acetyltransferase
MAISSDVSPKCRICDMQLKENQIYFRTMEQGEEACVADFVLKIFTEFVAPQNSLEGVAEFKKRVNSDALAQRLEAGNIILLAESGQNIISVIEMRENSHIGLLFVEKFHQRKGIAKELIQRSIAICRQRKPDVKSITVNSSPNAFEAYQKIGFKCIEDEKVKNGIRFIPMELILE